MAVIACGLALQLPERGILLTLLVYAGFTRWMLALRDSLPDPRELNLANAMTLARLILAAVLAGHLVDPSRTTVIATVAIVALLLDLVDGPIARARNAVTGFGARFDMETDSLVLLVCTAMLWLQERAGPWILVVGLARYAFIAAGRLDARFAAELPASERRRNAAAATMAAVAIALIPITPNGLALHAALLATGVTILSFLIDIIFLLKKYRKYE